MAASSAIHPLPISVERMRFALFALLLAAPAVAEPPVVVTGHVWAPFISPMGEPFRATSTAEDTLGLWFNQADRDRDGLVTAAEFQADADRFFLRLDENGDRRIEPEELVRYEWEIAPDVQLNAKTRRSPGDPPPKKVSDRSRRRPNEGVLQGAARYALLNLPEPVAAADRNFDRSITDSEFRAAAAERFQLLDTDRRNGLSFAALDRIRTKMIAEGKRKRRRSDDEDNTRLATPL